MYVVKISFRMTICYIFVLFLLKTIVFGDSVLSLDTMKDLLGGRNDSSCTQKLAIEEMTILRGSALDQCIQYDYCWDPRCQAITIIPPKYVLCDDEQQPFWCKPGRTDDDWCVSTSVTCSTTNRPIYDNANCTGDPISNTGKCEKTQAGTTGTNC